MTQLHVILVYIPEQQCTVEGQVYKQCGPPVECHPTCSNPNPSCLQGADVCVPGCVCPQNTVFDEIHNECVPLSQCSKS